MSEPPPLLERLGVAYLERLSHGVQVLDEDGVHLLNDRELAALRATSRGAVVRAVIAGGLSSLASALAEVAADRYIGVSQTTMDQQLRWWGIVLGVTAVASVLEIAYLYRDSLRAVHRLTVEAGLDLFGNERDERLAVTQALARAALELPNPPRGLYGLDATREATRFELLVAPLVYKLKTSASNFLFKALLRRALGRTALRGYLQTLLPFAAIPVTALWNGVVAWLVVREARLRVLGPSAARQLAGLALGDAPLSPAARSAALHAIAGAVVKSVDLHPNLTALLTEVVARVGEPPEGPLGDMERFLEELGALDENEARAVLRLLCVAAVIDGKLHRSERKLLDRAFERRGLRVDPGAVERLRRLMLRGKPIGPDIIEALAPATR
jgi:hypothetical protein